MKYRKKPGIIEAFRWMYDVVPDWWRNANGIKIEAETGCGFIPTLDGILKVSRGDWVIRGVKDELYTCKPDIFEATYELVNEANKKDNTMEKLEEVEVKDQKEIVNVLRGCAEEIKALRKANADMNQKLEIFYGMMRLTQLSENRGSVGMGEDFAYSAVRLANSLSGQYICKSGVKNET